MAEDSKSSSSSLCMGPGSVKGGFVALQDRFVSSLAVACCPTMDLVAVLTLDHHLLVHRTTSWQKLLHIKPSDVGFEMMTLSWKPDGLQLAVGCEEGDVAIFEIESGEILPERHSSFRHEHRITAMHWTKLSEIGASTSKFTHKRRRRKGPESLGEDWNYSGVMSQSKGQFRRRSSRFLKGYNGDRESDDTVLVTADKRGFIALWWMGRVLLTRIDMSKHFAMEELQILESMGCQRSKTGCFCIERVDMAPDLSLLFVLLAFSSDRGTQDAGVSSSATKLHRILTLNMTTIQHFHEDVALVAGTVDQVHEILNAIATTGKQMTTEWKNATRIFELKMGLIGSLYEKYACEDPPQVDMLSVVVTGITAPALAQYFSQDIQEMSVHRMQKALFSGCDSLRTLVDEKLKRDLTDLLFLLSELRGHTRWNTEAYAGTLGITVSALDGLLQTTQDALMEVEVLTLALHETHQDFALFFQWILERIRIHTSSTQTGSRATTADAGGAAQGSKSLLNLRRLCDFLQRAAEAAQHFRNEQANHSKYKVETTFGNPVSVQLSTRPTPSVNGAGSSCLTLIKCIQDQWSALLGAMAVTLAQTTVRETSGCFTIDTNSNTSVEECRIHFRQPFSTRLSNDDDDEYDDQSDDEENEEGAIDWNSLRHYGPMVENLYVRSVVLIGFRFQSGIILLLRASRDEGNPQSRSKSPSHLTWDAAIVNFSQESASDIALCRGFDFYGSLATDKNEQLAFVVDRDGDGRVRQEWLYLHPYDNIKFSRADPATSFKAILAQGPTHTFKLEEVRGRAVASISTPAPPGRIATSVIAAASRGVLCAILPPSRLIVFDGEDSEDDEDEENEGSSGADENDNDS